MSVLPATAADKRTGVTGRPLSAANGSTINTWGTKKVRLHLCDQSYEWPFLIAAVDRPLLGADFLRHTGLLVDVRGSQLINADTFSSAPLTAATCHFVHGLTRGPGDC